MVRQTAKHGIKQAAKHSRRQARTACLSVREAPPTPSCALSGPLRRVAEGVTRHHQFRYASSKPFTNRPPRKEGTQGRVTATSSGCRIAIAKQCASRSEIYRSHHLRNHCCAIHGTLPALEIIPGCFVNRRL